MIVSILLYLFISSVAVYFTSWLLPGISVNGYSTAIAVAAVLGLLNAFVKPLLVVLSLPVTFLTLGLFMLVINTVIILLAGWMVGGFHVENFWWALLFSVIVSIVMSLLEQVI